MLVGVDTSPVPHLQSQTDRKTGRRRWRRR